MNSKQVRELVITTKSYALYKDVYTYFVGNKVDGIKTDYAIFKKVKDVAGTEFLTLVNEYGFKELLLELIGEKK